MRKQGDLLEKGEGRGKSRTTVRTRREVDTPPKQFNRMSKCPTGQERLMVFLHTRRLLKMLSPTLTCLQTFAVFLTYNSLDR